MIRADRENWKAREVTRLLSLVETERHYYQEIVSGLPSGVAVLGADLCVGGVNSRFGEVLGLTSKDVLGRSLTSFLPAPELREALAAALRTGQPQRNVIFQYPVTGVPRRLRAALSALRPTEDAGDTEERGLLLLIDDIPAAVPPVVPRATPPAPQPTDPEEPFTEKMDTLSRITGHMAHEFNNLLMVINGYGEEVIDKLRVDDPAREDAQEILNAANRATELTRLLLAYARRQVMDLGPVDLNRLLTNLADRLRRVAGESVDLVLELDSHLARAKTNAAQIEQAIGTLVSNAREAIDGAGTIAIHTATAANAPDLGPGSYVALSVRDTGRGMDAATLRHLFEPFFTTKKLDHGLGLGLAATYGIVRQSGGTITVESQPGAGATFTIYLPTAEEATATPPRATVLVVEEERGMRALIDKILRRNGYQALEAASAEEALRISAEHDGPIDLLITGMALTQMSGRELRDRILAARAGIKPLYIFGYTDNDAALASQLPDSAVFLQKPFSAEALLGKIRSALTA